jgi:acyl dehydratase
MCGTGTGSLASTALFLEDLHVGQRFSSASHTVDEAQIKTFAAQFDPQPFHMDAKAAKATLFAGLAASGWHTAAITMKLLVESGLRSRAASSASAARSAGRSRRDRGTRSQC